MSYCSESMSITIGDFSESSGKYSESTRCRLCMKKNDYYFNIFTSIVASQITVEDALYDLVDLKVTVGDGLPCTICALCLEKLIEFNDFRNICHKSDAELRNVSCINYSRNGEGAVHDNMRSSTQTNDCVRDVIVSTSKTACSVQPNEIFIAEPDIQLPIANMLCHVKVENKESQREENNEMLHGKAPDGIESDAVDPLAMDDRFHIKEENIDPLGEENDEVLHGTPRDGFESDAMDPMAIDGLTSMASGGKEVDDEGRGVVLTGLDWKLIEAKKEPSHEEGDAAKAADLEHAPNSPTHLANHRRATGESVEDPALSLRTPCGAHRSPAGSVAKPNLWRLLWRKPTFNENGEFMENLAMDIESTVEAVAPERFQVKASSAAYLLALGDVRTAQSYGCLPPSTTVTLIESKSGASHAEGGRNVIDEDLGRCSVLILGEGTSCLFPSDGQSYTKDIKASKISVDGTRKSFVGVGCDSLDATDSLACIESREKRVSGNEALIGEKEEISNYLIKNTGNSCRSNKSSCNCLSTRDGLNSKDDVSKLLQTNLGARNLDGDVQLSEGRDESIKAIVSDEESDISCQHTTSNNIGGMKRKGRRKKGNGLIEENSGRMEERESLRKNSEISTVDRKLCPQNLSLQSYSSVGNNRDEARGSSMERVYSCSVCTKSFTQSRILSEHMLTHAREESYSCEMCDKCFFSRDHLNEHLLRHTAEKPYSCDVCRKSFSRKSLLVIHCRTHTGERPFSCSICCKSFAQRYSLHHHMHTHSMEKPYYCNVCGKPFSRKKQLVLHGRTHSGERPYACSLCRKSFYQSSDLIRHKRTHTGEKPYSCSVCSDRFSQSGTLSKHMLRHTGEKPHSCDVCNKSFSRKSNFLVHYRTHTGERPFSCSVCSKSYHQKYLLTIHMHTHAIEKPYPCNVCSKSFLRRHELDNHVRIHTREKPYSCDVCDKTFPRKNDLAVHCRKHKGERPFSCNLCSKSYYQSSHLIQHKRTHAREKP